ncbi:MAG: helix-turn-helix domain-containing protein [Bacillota bacterium]
MQEIGDLLREARESKGMTLQDLERATMIRRKYLEAIESGDVSKLPGEVQLRGFVRIYAAAVGLDPDEVMNRYREARGSTYTAAEDTLTHEKTEILVVEERRPIKIILAAIVLLAVFVLVAGAVYYFLVCSNPQDSSAHVVLLQTVGLNLHILRSEPAGIGGTSAITYKTQEDTAQTARIPLESI